MMSTIGSIANVRGENICRAPQSDGLAACRVPQSDGLAAPLQPLDSLPYALRLDRHAIHGWGSHVGWKELE